MSDMIRPKTSSKTRYCIMDNCPVDLETTSGGAKGLCARHYKQLRRGRLGVQPWERGGGSMGMNINFGYEVCKIDGEWHRRKTGSREDWQLVVWPERDPLHPPKFRDGF